MFIIEKIKGGKNRGVISEVSYSETGSETSNTGRREEMASYINQSTQ